MWQGTCIWQGVVPPPHTHTSHRWDCYSALGCVTHSRCRCTHPSWWYGQIMVPKRRYAHSQHAAAPADNHRHILLVDCGAVHARGDFLRHGSTSSGGHVSLSVSQKSGINDPAGRCCWSIGGAGAAIVSLQAGQSFATMKDSREHAITRHHSVHVEAYTERAITACSLQPFCHAESVLIAWPCKHYMWIGLGWEYLAGQAGCS